MAHYILVHGGAERYGLPIEALFEASDIAGGGNALWKREGEGRNDWRRRRSGRGRKDSWMSVVMDVVRAAYST